MIKRYLLDAISILVLALFIPFLLINKPHLSDYYMPSLTAHSPVLKKMDKKKKAEQTVKMSLSYLKKRNIFSPDGSYFEKKGKALPTAQSYRLIGIFLRSGVKKAVLTDPTGQVFVLKEGERLNDGSVILHIGNASITLKRGNEKKVLKVFHVAQDKILKIGER